jgi:hypothetical protein
VDFDAFLEGCGAQGLINRLGWKQPVHVAMPVMGEVPAKPRERSYQSSYRPFSTANWSVASFVMAGTS